MKSRYIAKEEILASEGDRWFERNIEFISNVEASMGTKCLVDFLKANHELFINESTNVLEIGSSFGYNLDYLSKNFPQIGGLYGIEPSEKAVKYGGNLYQDRNIKLCRGTADDLPFEDESFDIIIYGFCFYNIDRKLLFKCISEADRVVKEGGIVCICDFDTANSYKRVNRHNNMVPTYKMNIANMFTAHPQYNLIEKNSISENGKAFDSNIQNRVALSIIYKSSEDESYINA